MAILISRGKKPVPYPKALEKARTRDVIELKAKYPKGIEDATWKLPHWKGVLSLIQGIVYLNDFVVCSNDVEETHADDFFPFYDDIGARRKKGKLHEFFVFDPFKQPVVLTHPRVIEADEFQMRPLLSGKGLVIIGLMPQKEGLPKRQINLVKDLRIGDRLKGNRVASIIDVEIAWEGPHMICLETPSSVVVGSELTTTIGGSVTQFFRGHGNNNELIHTCYGNPLDKSWLATDNDLFRFDQADGYEIAISTKTNEPIYRAPNLRDNLYVTSQALVWRDGHRIEANGKLVTNSFFANWVVPFAHGLYYGWEGEIFLLVIKDVPQDE